MDGKVTGRPAPLRCLGYYATELSLTSNPEHKAGEKVRLDFGDLMIESTTEEVPQEKGGSLWRVALRVRQGVTDPDKNAPYNFAIALLGSFKVHPKYPADKVRQLVEVNGSSVLYSAARQILRQAMANGPYIPLLLPCASFLNMPEEAPGDEADGGKQEG